MELKTNIKRADGLKQKAGKYGLPIVIIITIFSIVTAILLLRNFSEESRDMLLTVFWVSFLATVAIYILMQDIRVLVLTIGIVVMYVGVFKYHQTLVDQSYANYSSVSLENLNIEIQEEMDLFGAKVTIDDNRNFYFWMRSINKAGSNHPVAVVEQTNSTVLRDVTIYGAAMEYGSPVHLYFDEATECICLTQDSEVCNALLHHDDQLYYEKLVDLDPVMQYKTTLVYNENEDRWVSEQYY